MNNSSQKPGNKGKSVQTLMRQRNTSLGNILTHARVLNRLDNRLEAILDSKLTPHCQVADFRNHCLILVCSSATFATRIRMISQQLLDSFKEEGERGIERIEIRIAPVNRPQPSTRKRKGLSSAAVQALGRFASDSGDADIQAIFDGINARRNR